MNAKVIEQLFYKLAKLDNLKKYRIDISFIFFDTAKRIVKKEQKDFNNQIIICVNDFLSGEKFDRISNPYPNIKCYILIESDKICPSYCTQESLTDDNTFYNIWLEDENGNYLLGTL